MSRVGAERINSVAIDARVVVLQETGVRFFHGNMSSFTAVSFGFLIAAGSLLLAGARFG